MFALQSLHRSLLALAFAAVAGVAAAAAPFAPQIGQEGKDVIWVPTQQVLIERMLNAAKVTPNDYVIDLGSGDGRTVIAAAKRGAKALGIEYNADMVELSKQNAEKEGVAARASFVKADIFESDFSQATVITMYLLPQINLKLRPKILAMKAGTRVVSNTFKMDDWIADEEISSPDNVAFGPKAFMWIVPAKVEGNWQLAQGELTLKQNFQMLSGTLKSGASSTTISSARLDGDRIAFTVGTTEYSGRVSGNVMSGTLKGGATWQATRR